MPVGFNDINVARKLKRLALHGPDGSRLRRAEVEPLIASSHVKHYVIQLDTAIPAAALNTETNRWEVRCGTGKVFMRDSTGEEDNSQDPLNFVNDPSNMIQWEDDNGLQIERRVWNSQETEAPANKLLHAVQDERGDLYVIMGGGTSSPLGIPFINNSGEIIPPGAVMYAGADLIVGDTPYILASKPSVWDRFWLINGPTPVPVLGTSLGSWLTDLTGFVAVASGSVFNGISYGPKPGSWLLHDYRLGFTALSTTTQTVFGQTVAHFKQHVINQVTGLMYEKMEQGQTKQFEIWLRNSGGTPVVSGWNKINGRDGMYLNKDEYVDKDTTVTFEWYSGFWELRNAKCVKNDNDYLQSGPSQMAFQSSNFLVSHLLSRPESDPTQGALGLVTTGLI